VLTASVAGAGRSGAVPGVVASTTYSVTVANDDAAGIGPASQPFTITAGPATIVPGKPTINYAVGYADIAFAPPPAGNSAIDEYDVLATGGGQNLDTVYPATSMVLNPNGNYYVYMAPQPADMLTVTVRAHNAAGWGPWSAPVYFADGGGD
jgi:hypothetical protein